MPKSMYGYSDNKKKKTGHNTHKHGSYAPRSNGSYYRPMDSYKKGHEY